MKTVHTILASWQKPGFSLIVSDPEQSSLFWYQLRHAHEHRVLTLPSTHQEYAAWAAELSQSFLGQTQVYWLASMTGYTKSSKVREQVQSFLRTYQGPHAVWGVCTQEVAADYSGAKKQVVSPLISVQDMGEVSGLLGYVRSAKVLEALSLFGPRDMVSLDTVTQVLWHADYVPMKERAQTAHFLQSLLPQEAALSHLAELFFKRKKEAFFAAWQRCSAQYGDMFWISFWAEQLWRAYWVCFYMKRGQQTRAKGMAFRLPASFFLQEWRQHTPEGLLAWYEAVAFFDASLKKGSVRTISDLLLFFLC